MLGVYLERMRAWSAAILVAGLTVLAAALVGGAGGAWAQSDWDKVVAEAKKEGKVVVYNGTNFKVVRKLGDAFQKEYGIPVEVLDGRASEIRERIRVEQSTNRTVASLSYSGLTTLFTQTGEGAFQEHGPLPNAQGVIPELASKGHVLLGSVGMFLLMYNTTLVKPEEVPKSWRDLTDPRSSGRQGPGQTPRAPVLNDRRSTR